MTQNHKSRHLVAGTLLCLGHFIILAPLLLPVTFEGAINALQNHPLLIALLCALNILQSFVVLIILKITSLLFRFSKVVSALVNIILLTLYYSALSGAVFYFSKLGSYPGQGVLREFLAAPTVFIEYSGSGVSPNDRLLFWIVVILCVGSSAWALRTLSNARFRTVTATSLLPAVASLLIIALPNRPEKFEILAQAAHSTTPIFRYYWGAASLYFDTGNKNSLTLVTEYLPLSTANSDFAPSVRPKHVLFIIAESLRADHLPFYNPEMLTFPKLFSHAQDWVVFSRAFSQGSGTSMSFPVIFTNRYLVSLEQETRSALLFWESLRAAKYRSGFFSAGAMAWGNIEDRLYLNRADSYFQANRLREEDRLHVTSRAHDYAVRDEVVLQQYSDFLTQLTSEEKSFAVVHLVGSHYPYDIDPSFNQFQPAATLNDWKLNIHTIGAPPDVNKIHNAYKNSLLHIDHQVQVILDDLKKRGILDQSLIFLTSDHGESFGERGYLFHSMSLFNNEIKVPLLVRAGSSLTGYRERLELQQHDPRGLIDILPSVLDSAGAKIPETFQGLSFFDTARKPYELSPYKFNSEKIALMRGNMKFIYDLGTHEAHAYDLDRDPGEMVNLWVKPVPNLRSFLDILKQREFLVPTSR